MAVYLELFILSLDHTAITLIADIRVVGYPGLALGQRPQHVQDFSKDKLLWLLKSAFYFHKDIKPCKWVHTHTHPLILLDKKVVRNVI